MAAKRGPEDDGFLEIEFDDAPTPPAHPQVPTPPFPTSGGQPDTKRRWRLPLVVSAVVVVLAAGGYAFFSNRAAHNDPDAALPTSLATQSQPVPRPEVDTGPVITVTDREQLLNEPQLAWDRSGESFSLLRSSQGYVSRTSVTTQNTSDAVVLTYLNENGHIELLAIDGRTGTALWQLSLDEGIERCVLLADGHQIGCIAKGGARSYVTIFSSRTGEPFGTSAWQTDCIAEDIAGEASNLIIAGYTLSTKEPCLASGPVWDQEQHVLISDGGPKNVDPAFPGVFLELLSGHLIAVFDDEQFIIDHALTQMVPAPRGSWFSVDEIFGPYQLSDDVMWQTETFSEEYFGESLSLSFLDPGTHQMSGSKKFLGAPWTRLGRGQGEQPQVLGVGKTVYNEQGEPLWELPSAPSGSRLNRFYLTPDVALRVLDVIEESGSAGDASDAYWGDVVVSATISAHDLLTGTLLWTTTVDGGANLVDVFGDASIWVQFLGDGEVSVQGLDLRTGDWGWTLPEEKEAALDEFNYFDLTVIGDVLIRAGYGAVSAFTFEP